MIKHLLVAFFDWSNWHRVTVDTKSAVFFNSICFDVSLCLLVYSQNYLYRCSSPDWLAVRTSVRALCLINGWCSDINHSITSLRFRNKLLSLVFMLLVYLSIDRSRLLCCWVAVCRHSSILFLLWPVPKLRSILLASMLIWLFSKLMTMKAGGNLIACHFFPLPC